MPGTQNRNEDVFAKYNAMSTEELQQILREDASKPEGQEETSMEALFYIMEVLAQRRRVRNEGKTPEEALEAFHKYYEEDEVSSKTEREPVVRKKNSTTPNWVKRLVAAAAIIILIFSGSITAKAFGFDLWEIIVKWTQETFHFGYISDGPSQDPSPESTQIFESFNELLRQYNITTPLIPQWIPDGYKEVSVQSFETPKQRQLFGRYQNGDKVIKIWIEDYLDGDPTQIEQSESAVEVYEHAGVKYYIIRDNEQYRAAWIRDSFSCYVSGPLSIDELKQMIISIEKG